MYTSIQWKKFQLISLCPILSQNTLKKHLNFIPKNHIIFKTNIQKTAFNKNKKIAKHVFLS